MTHQKQLKDVNFIEGLKIWKKMKIDFAKPPLKALKMY